MAKKSPGKPTIEFPPMAFGLDMRLRVPTANGEWEGSLAQLLQVDLDHPSQQLIDASAQTAFWGGVVAHLTERVALQQDAIRRLRGRALKNLLEHPPKDETGTPINLIRLTKGERDLWVETMIEHETALVGLRQTEKLLSVAETAMWEFKSFHKDIQILTDIKGAHNTLERSTPASVDPARRRLGRSPEQQEPLRLEDQIGSDDFESEDDDAEKW